MLGEPYSGETQYISLRERAFHEFAIAALRIHTASPAANGNVYIRFAVYGKLTDHTI